MKTSAAAVEKLKAVEGFRAKAYPDGYVNGVQMYSIGYGHQIRSTEQSLKTAMINKAKGHALFVSDLAPLEGYINAANAKTKKKLNQNQFDALVSFGYNCGSGALNNILATWIATEDTKQVTDRMAKYVKTRENGTNVLVNSSQLEQRRASEIMLFNKPYMPVLLIGGVSVALFALLGARFF